MTGAWPSVVALPMLLRIAHGLRIDMTWPITEHDAACHAPFLEPVSTFDGPTYAAPGPFASDAQASIEIELRVRATQNVTRIAPAGRVLVATQITWAAPNDRLLEEHSHSNVAKMLAQSLCANTSGIVANLFDNGRMQPHHQSVQLVGDSIVVSQRHVVARDGGFVLQFGLCASYSNVDGTENTYLLTGPAPQCDSPSLVSEHPWSPAIRPLYDSTALRFEMAADVRVRNPYGFLPSSMVVRFAATALRCVLQGAALIWFAVLMRAHRSQLLRMHCWVLGVLVCGLVDALGWVGYLAYLNDGHGAWQCGPAGECRLTPSMALPACLQALRESAAFSVLLLVCSGLGVWRPRLQPAQNYGIAILSTARAACAAAYAVIRYNKNTDAHAVAALFWLYALTTAIFFGWIFSALLHSRDVLQDAGETVKLAKYKRLYCALRWVTLSLAATMLGPGVGLEWSWRYAGMWEAVADGVAAVATIVVAAMLRPCENSLHTFAFQLPDADDDADADAVTADAVSVELASTGKDRVAKGFIVAAGAGAGAGAAAGAVTKASDWADEDEIEVEL